MSEKKERLSIPNLIIILASLLWLLPLILIFLNSFKPYNDMMQNFLALPKSWSLDMYIETWTTFGFPKLITNTLFYTACAVLLIVIFAPMAAYKLSRTKGMLSKICFVLIIMPMMVPFQSYMISLTKLVSNVNLSGTRLGYILVSTGLMVPLAVYMIHGFVKNIPFELEEAAEIDGAGPIRKYFSIILPMLKPIISTVVVLDALSNWNDIIVNQLIVGGKAEAMNIQNALYMRFSAQTTDWEHALPGIVMSMIPCLIFFIVMQKHIVGGMTAGAVKG